MTVRIDGPASLPLNWGGTTAQFKLLHFTLEDGQRWAAVYIGSLDTAEPMPLRIESACFFGHVLRSGQCDCGYQLEAAMRQFAETGRGLLVYGMDQDARGLGTAAHFAIYQMRQQENLDTAAVFERLGAPWDVRSYDPVVTILRHLGLSSVVLLSNNEGRARFLRDNGVDARMEALESPLDVYNMSTLMLEKEDLGYLWSFETHADWLEPMQLEVESDLNRSIALAVVPGQGLVGAGETIVRGDPWTLCEQLAVLPLSDGRPGPLVVYLTDLPRVDDVARYRQLGADVIVAPFNPIPRVLTLAGEQAGVRMVDWARRNAYRSPRPQWTLTWWTGGMHVYRRGDRLRYVALGDPDEAKLRIEGLSKSIIETTGRPDSASVRGYWLEVEARDSLRDAVLQEVTDAVAESVLAA